MFLVCGEALFDLFLDSAAGSELRFDGRVGGPPFNVAIGLARLGRRAALFTGLSTDFLGQRLAAALAADGVDPRFLLRKDAPTTLSLVGLAADGTPSYAFYGRGAADRSVEVAELPALGPALGPEVAALHFGSYSLVARPTADALAALAAREACRRLVTLDPNVRLNVEPDLDVWRTRIAALAGQADLIKVSSEDLEALYPGQPAERAAERWLAGGARLVVATRGADGAEAFTTRERVAVPGETVAVVDTVGAGDSFQAALLCALAERGCADRSGLETLDGPTLRGCLAFAVRAAAITCTRRGAALPARRELPALA
ncbi:MAG: carbohydrate kinase [Dongiaceae bacterium]